MDKNLQERLDKIEKSLSSIADKTSSLYRIINCDEFDDFFHEHDYEEDENFDWWSIAYKIKMYEPILLALYKKLNLDLENPELKAVEKLVVSERENRKLEDKIARMQNEISQKDRELIERTRDITKRMIITETELQTWQRIVDEMAHSINTDVFAALSNLNEITDDTAVNKAKHNIKRIRDIANLIMWDLNKARLPASTTILEIDLHQLIQTQIDAIKDGIDSLRLSIREHKSKLTQLVIPITAKNECAVRIDDNIETGLELIIKDLLRNAFQNTDEENPFISVEIFPSEDFISLIITNNRLISEKELLWFNEGIDDDDIQMSKSSKVGLRLVKRWFKNLSINGNFLTDPKTNQTSIKLQIPKVIRYEKI